MRAYKVKINGKVVAVSGIAESEVVNCVSLTHSRKENEDIDTLLNISGSYFENGKQVSSVWYEPLKQLKLGDTIEVELVDVEKVDEPTEITELKDEKKCSFCKKSNKQVEYIFEKDAFLFICSDCIESCMKDIVERRHRKS